MSLYKAEMRRLTKRRFTRWLVAGSLAVLAAIAVGMALTNEKVGPEQIAAAQAEADRSYQEQVRFADQERQRCEAAQGTADAASYPANCADMYRPVRDDFQYQWYMPATFEFRAEFKDMVFAFAAILAMMAFVVGASYVGAEWASGGMMNLLLWVPRRLRVLGTKLLVLLTGLTGLVVAAGVVWTAAFVVLGRVAGTMDGVTSGVWQSYALMGLRALAVVLTLGAVGFGLASIGRHTALALGAAVGVIVVFQFGLYVVLQLAGVAFADVVLLPVWAIAWMDKEIKLVDYNSCNYSATSGCVEDTLTLTWPMAGAGMVALLLLVVGTAMWTMRNRDIT